MFFGEAFFKLVPGQRNSNRAGIKLINQKFLERVGVYLGSEMLRKQEN